MVDIYSPMETRSLRIMEQRLAAEFMEMDIKKDVSQKSKFSDLRLVSKELQTEICEWAMNLVGSNLVRRHRQLNCLDLFKLDRTCSLNRLSFTCNDRVRCYSCPKLFKKCHPVYTFCCRKCGDKFQKNRHLSRDLSGKKTWWRW